MTKILMSEKIKGFLIKTEKKIEKKLKRGDRSLFFFSKKQLTKFEKYSNINYNIKIKFNYS